MKTRKLKAVYGGQTFTRTTHRTYTHVVIGRNLTPLHEGQRAGPDGVAIAWSGRLDLAQEQKKRLAGFWREIEIIEVIP